MTAETAFRLRAIAALLSKQVYLYRDEATLHTAIQAVLEGAGWPVAHEQRSRDGGKNRFDFFHVGGIVIEIKIKGSLADALRQCVRYCKDTEVQGILLAAACDWAARAPEVDFEKPVQIVRLRRQAF
jgi:hypothetical protein